MLSIDASLYFNLPTGGWVFPREQKKERDERTAIRRRREKEKTTAGHKVCSVIRDNEQTIGAVKKILVFLALSIIALSLSNSSLWALLIHSLI